MTNLFDISDKVIVITGGYGILGRAIARYLVEQGAIVVIIGRSVEKGNALATELSAIGRARFLQADVLDREALTVCRDTILTEFGCVDVLINAAGGNMPGATIPPEKTFLDLDVEAVRNVVDLNLFGTMIPTQIFVEPMAKAQKGVILNFSSESALRPLTRVCGYGTAKAAIFTSIRSMLAPMTALTLFFRTPVRKIRTFPKATNDPKIKPMPPASRYVSTGIALLPSVLHPLRPHGPGAEHRITNLV